MGNPFRVPEIEVVLLSEVGTIDCSLLHMFRAQSSVNFISMSAAENNAQKWDAVISFCGSLVHY